MNETTLSFTVTGESLRGMLTEARKVANEFFGDVPFRLVSFPVSVHDEQRAMGGEVVHRTFIADAVYEMVPQQHPAGYFEVDDDDDEVRIP